MALKGVMPQGVPITLNQGWNWISYPHTQPMSIEEAMGSFTPAEGDQLKSQQGYSTYLNGSWQGSLHVLEPGKGYMYMMAGGGVKSFVFGDVGNDPSAIPEAAMEGEFTVDANQTKVRFSPGNLQCRIDPNQAYEATVVEGTGTTNYMPIYTFYKYSLCQILYYSWDLADEGMGPGTVTGIAFESESTNCYLRNGIEIWMSPTTLTTAPSTSVSTSGMTKVFEGSIIQQVGWTPIRFSTPFTWDGESNVLVTIVMNHGSYNSSTPWKSHDEVATVCGYSRNDNAAYAPSTSTYSLTRTSNCPNTRFMGKGCVVWRFAENQTDVIGQTNTNVSSTYNGWIDLFGYGTSGHVQGQTCYQPWSTSTTTSDYATSSLDFRSDWGFNAIHNGGNQGRQWRTLTGDEWDYLLNTRSTSSGKRFTKAKVNGVNGLILLPDNWKNSYYSLNGTNSTSTYYSANTLTPAQWSTVEQHGAVFLPVAGYRHGTEIANIDSWGYYWSSSYEGGEVYCMAFGSSQMSCGYHAWQADGQSVRLVFQSNPRIRTVSVIPATHSATVTCEVDWDGYTGNVYRGVQWWSTKDPLDYTYDVGPTGAYTIQINGLLSGTTYEVAAIMTPSGVFKTGNRVVFTTESESEGAAAGLFSVSANEQVEFAKGNLHYQASTDTWRFAEHPWDIIGEANANISSSYTGWIDLFGWGTGGWNPGNTYYHPWDSDNSAGALYGPPGANNLTRAYANCDWGHNSISNGGNLPNQWRTLTLEEWAYVFTTRSTSTGIRYAKATVNNVNGVVLLPDNWKSSYYSLNSTNTSDAAFTTNVISASDWVTLESHGAVFLPAAGRRNGTSVSDVGSNSYYCSSSYCDSNSAYNMHFGDGYLGAGNAWGYRYRGFSVRLVRSAR